MLISVVVPIYNVENYISDCIESIKKQTFSDFEVLLINDGSTDNSRMICEHIVKEDSRFRLINKENGGLSDARNKGIEEAKGKYLLFVDSDDYLPLDALEKLAAVINNSNYSMIVGRFNHIYDTYEKESEPFGKSFEISNSTCIKEMLIGNKINHSASGKLYKADLFKNIRFPYGKLFEDMFTIYDVTLQCKRIEILDEAIYCYRHRENSILTSSKNLEKKCNDLFSACQHIKSLFLNDKQLYSYASRKTVYQNILIIQFAKYISDKEISSKIKKRSKSDIKKHIFSYLLNAEIRIKTKLKVLFIFLFY